MSRIFSSKLVKDLLYTQEVFTCAAHESIRKIVGELAKKNVGAVVVTDLEGKVVGIFTERDLLRLIGKQGPGAIESPVGEYMTHPVKVVREETILSQSFALMRMAKFRHLVVVSDDNKCLGIISMKDAFDYTCDFINTEVTL